MNSDELNEVIGEVCDESDEHDFEAFGGKVIPYIGWFWREVDFDEEDYSFGVIPADAEFIDCQDGLGNKVGFMENNKWGYPYVQANKEQWKEIKKLLVVAVTEKTVEAFDALNKKIQSLAEGLEWKSEMIKEKDFSYPEWVLQKERKGD